MPLVKSASKTAVGKNIAKEEASGKKPKQSIASALRVKREAAKVKRKAVLETAYNKYMK